MFVSIEADDGSAITDGVEARLTAALDYWNSHYAYLGITFIQVDAGSGATDFAIHISDTSACGGLADGVLGCTTADGTISVIKGWDWYTGADGTAVGASQFDFQTIITHELGHAIGLGHSGDTASVMYAYLAPGQAKRTLTEADLTVVDYDGGGSHALRAELPAGTASPPDGAGEIRRAPAPRVGPTANDPVVSPLPFLVAAE